MDTTQTIQCTDACTITLVVTPQTASQDMYDAVNGVFAALLAALVVVWGAKLLYRRFMAPTDA